LRFQGRKRVHNADEIMAEIVAKRLLERLDRAGVVMKRVVSTAHRCTLQFRRSIHTPTPQMNRSNSRSLDMGGSFSVPLPLDVDYYLV
jgi:hypothetical protein